VLDLNGNQSGGFCTNFTTGSSAVSTAPQVVATNPSSGAIGAATNAQLEVVFDSAIDTSSLGQITMTANGAAVPFLTTLSPNYYYLGTTVVQLLPASLLNPNTTYTVTIAGVRDLAGNAMASPYTFSFTTGTDALLNTMNMVSATVSANSVQTTLINGQMVNNVDANTAVTLTFSEAVDIVSLLNRGALLVVDATTTPVPVTITASADGKTAVLTPQLPLAAGTQYRLEVHYNVVVFDQAGKYLGSGGGGFFRLVTQ
jgi:Bacterial Ig-like domain